MTTPTIVYKAVPGFSAITEFVAPSPQTDEQKITDACGPTGNEICQAACQRRAPSIAHMVAIRTRDIEHGWFTPHGGQNLHDVYLDATELGGMTVTETPQGSSVDVIHQALKEACLRGNPCVLDLFDAEKLPENEQHVFHHFVAIGAIHTTKGYLCANPDHAPPTFGPVGTYWVTWNQIAAAQPVGLLEYHMPPAPAPTPTPPPVVHAPPPDPATPLRAVLQQIQTLSANALK